LPTVESSPTLTVDQISKVYVDLRSGRSVAALRKVSFELREGDFVCILGPSGCGKSTLLKIIAGLIKPSAGSVCIHGRQIHGPGADRGMIFQEYALYPWKTVQDNVEFGLIIKGEPRAKRAARAREFIELVGLRGFEDRYPRELSGGMKQRVAVARALANDPQLLLLDEPFAAVDALTRQRLQEEIGRISERTKMTMLFVTHSVDEAAFLADRIIVLTPRPGEIQEIVDVDLKRPRTWKAVSENQQFTQLTARMMNALHETASGRESPVREPEVVTREP